MYLSRLKSCAKVGFLFRKIQIHITPTQFFLANSELNFFIFLQNSRAFISFGNYPLLLNTHRSIRIRKHLIPFCNFFMGTVKLNV